MTRGRQTRKSRKPNNSFKTTIVETFLGILNTVKLYHWGTYSYAKHKATDDLYKLLNEHIDKFVEIMMGKDEQRIPEFSKKINNPIINFKARIHEYREFLINLNKTLDKDRDTDLLNVRDEILGDINQFLYLMTLTK
jgi:DNA-binding ferritin-like protein